jgi:peroxiredoxin Q/BCP
MNALKIGNKAPYFEGKNQNDKTISLDDFKGKRLILYFYPKDLTSGCTAQACDLRDNYEMWLSKGFVVIGKNTETQTTHLKFIEKNNLPFDLISDTNAEISQKYGAWGEKSMYGRKYMGIFRKTFIINEDGFIEEIFEKANTKGHSAQILNVINF